MSSSKKIALAITGASGVQYGFRLLEVLLKQNHHVYLMLSKAAQVVTAMESDLKLPARKTEQKKYLSALFNTDSTRLDIFGDEEWTAPVASGSAKVDAMVVCPCTMSTLSQIAVGASSNLMERAADVMLKERRKLIIVPRETPFSDIHLQNMLRLSRMGVVVMPANPGFYNKPQSVNEIVDFMVARILDQLQIEQDLLPPWGQSSDAVKNKD
ncbi:MAG: UbiX family flavin prenyltransferase [Gammaproteobacteria bacterium]|nr:UbiX family flavin prenyltransferase [Gammaproteobacteria bacterium]